MPFTKKFPRSGDTKHIRVPVVYSDLVLELMEVYDSKFEIDKGKHLLRKYINQSSSMPVLELVQSPLPFLG